MLRIVHPLIAAAAVVALPVAALAQSGAGTGAVGGAVTGAIVGGPVGAAVGGVIGAVIGTAIVPPPQPIVSYVTAQPPPSEITLQGNLVVGATLPDAVVLTPVPPTVYVAPAGVATATYGYAFINGHRVVVDTKTRAVVAIVG